MHLVVKNLGQVHYTPVFNAMQQHALERSPAWSDEVWLLEHHPVYTQGYAGRQEHILRRNHIPIVQTDRGGQVTYHGPGQLILYTLIDLRRAQLNVHQLVRTLEDLVIDLLANYGINAERESGAPGVYVDHAKIASVGLRIKRGYSYHGLALNVDMDLEPFQTINPCGIEQLTMLDMKRAGIKLSITEVAKLLCKDLQVRLGYTTITSNESLPESLS